MKVLMVTGSRTWKSRAVILAALDKRDPKEYVVVHGGAKGADSIADEVARQIGFEVQVYPADWAKYGRGAGFVRNAQMASVADECLAFWDGESRGTAHARNTCMELGVPVYTYWATT